MESMVADCDRNEDRLVGKSQAIHDPEVVSRRHTDPQESGAECNWDSKTRSHCGALRITR